MMIRTETTRVGEQDTTLLISRNDGGSDGRHGVSEFVTSVCVSVFSSFVDYVMDELFKVVYR